MKRWGKSPPLRRVTGGGINPGGCKAEQGRRVIRPFRVSGTSPGWSRTADRFGGRRSPSQGGLEKWLPSRRRNPAGSRIRLMGSAERGPGGECRPAFAFSGGLLVGSLDAIGHVAVLTVNFVDFFKLLKGLGLFPHFLQGNAE